MSGPVILHISDMHHGVSSAHDNPDGLVNAVEHAIDLVRADALQPKYLFCSGDLGSRGNPKSIELAEQSLLQIAKRLGIHQRRIVLCPGNHDVDRQATEQYHQQHPEAADQEFMHQPRWGGKQYQAYMSVVRNIYGVDRDQFVSVGPPDELNDPSELYSLHYYPDDEMVVYSLNSTVCESHRPGDRYGYVGQDQIRRMDATVDTFCRDNDIQDIYSLMQVVVVHHPLFAPDDRDPSAMRDPFKLMNWLWSRGVDLVLHGHQHYTRTLAIQGRDANNSERAFVCAGAGSVGVRSGEMVDRRNSLNVISLKASRFGAREVRIRPGEFVRSTDSWNYHPGQERQYTLDPSRRQAAQFVESLGLKKTVKRLQKTQETIHRGESVVIEGAEAAFETYVEALERIGKEGELRVTSTLNSQFWSKQLEDTVRRANLDVKVKVGKDKVRRLFFTPGDIKEYIKQVVQRADNEARSTRNSAEWEKIQQVVDNLEFLAREFDMKISSPEEFRTATKFDPLREELAIYDFGPDRTRIDRFQLDDYGQVLGVKVQALRALDDWEARQFKERFDTVWSTALDVRTYLEFLQIEMERVKSAIGYTKSWLSKFDKLVANRDRTLEDESTLAMRYIQGINPQSDRHLDVGVCTGRYIQLLRPANRYRSNAIDIDVDVKNFIDGRFPDLEFKLGDIRVSDEAEGLGRDYGLITCMLGTCCHFGLDPKVRFDRRSGFDEGMRNMLGLLGPGGELVMSVWKRTGGHRLLNMLYTGKEIDRLLRETPDSDRIQKAVKAVGSDFEFIKLQATQELDLYAIRHAR